MTNTLHRYGDAASFHEVFVYFDKKPAELVGLRKEGKRLLEDDSDAEHAPSHSDSGDDEFWVEVPAELHDRVKVTARNFKLVIADGKEDFDVVPKPTSESGSAQSS